MKKNELFERSVFIDRLTGLPYGQDNVTFPPSWMETWTLAEIQERAKQLGKEFQPYPEIAKRLENDLSNGALVFFTETDVMTALQAKRIEDSMADDLINIVYYRDDIAVVPVSALSKTTLEYDDRNYR